MIESNKNPANQRCERSAPRFRKTRIVLILLGSVVALLCVYVAAGFALQSLFADPVDPSLGELADIRKSESGKADLGFAGILSNLSAETIANAPHPLDPLLEIAQQSRQLIDETIRDYQAVMVNQVRVGRRGLREPQFMEIKIRHEHLSESGQQIPFSIYTKFLKPENVAGQEAIWVRGQNDSKIVGHAAPGMFNLITAYLDPDGPIAMNGNLYPIYEMGFSRLLDIIIEKGIRDRDAGLCEVTIDSKVLLDDRPCILLEVRHPEKKPPHDFHIAKIYIDVEYQIPVGYEGYDWPAKAGDEPVLIEKYLYTKIELNPGLTDLDFDPSNPDYKYPNR